MPERLEGRDVIRATEAATDDDGVEWITIIKEGTSENNRRYRRSTLQKAVDDRVYENIRMFVDHSDGPPLKRSMKDLVSAITDVKFDTSFPDGKARVRGALKWIDETWQKKITNAKEHIGVSHDALLRGTRSVKNGRRFEDIDEIVRGNSVDWVIYPSAGGGFENYAQEGVEMTDAIDWDAIDEEMLKEHKPDLYKALTASRETESKEPEKNEEGPDNPPSNGTLDEKAVESIVSRALESFQAKQQERETVVNQVRDLVNKSTLPERTRNRLIDQFRGQESFDEKSVKQAIQDAKEELAEVAGPKIKGMGLTGKSGSGKSSLGRAHEAVAAVFERGLSTKKKSSKKSDDDDEEEEEE